MSTQTKIRSLTTALFEPLTESTKELLAPLNLNQSDFISIATADDDKFVLSLRSRFGEIIGHASYGCLKFFQRLPEKDFHPTSRDTVYSPSTDITCLLINSLFSEDRIRFEDENAETTFRYQLFTFASQLENCKKRALFKKDGTIPTVPDNFLYSPKYELANYQKAAVFTTLGTEFSALFAEQGTGKTIMEISRICNEARNKRVESGKGMYLSLIVVPKNLRSNWEREILERAITPGRVTVLRGGPMSRVEALMAATSENDPTCEWSIVIISLESVDKTWMPIYITPWDRITIDESHRIKGQNSVSTNRMLQLRDRAASRHILTGTPIANSVKDLWTQLEFLVKGGSGFSERDEFKKFYCKLETDESSRHGVEKIVGYQNLPFLQERLARMSFMITKKEALPELPEKSYDVIEVQMTPKQAEVYRQVLSSIKAEVDAASGDFITAENILTRMLRLAQVTSGFYKTDDAYSDDGETVVNKGEVKHLEENPKLKELMELVEQQEPNEKMIIWGCFVPDIKMITREIEAVGHRVVSIYGATSEKQREEAIRLFNGDPSVRVFVGNPAACREGINLWGYEPDRPEMETNVSRVIYYSQNWNRVHRSQSEDRCHRRGTRHHVLYTDLMIPNTIDEVIRKRVVEKILRADTIQDVTAILELVLSMKGIDND